MLFIDGSNLWHIVKSLAEGRHDTAFRIDFNALRAILTHALEVDLIRTYYFSSAPIDMSEAQQQFFHRLEYTGIRVVLNTLHDTAEGYREKGVDVRLACKALFLNRCFDVGILLTHDSDLIPAVEVLQDYGKRVVIAGFRDRLPARLRRATDSIIDLSAHWDSLRVADETKPVNAV